MMRHPKAQVGGARTEFRGKSAPTEVHHVPCSLLVRVLPANRQRAIDFIRGEVEAAHRNGLSARMLVPLTRGQGAAALQFEVELGNLDQLDQVRHRAGEPDEDSGSWMHGSVRARANTVG